MGFQIENGIGLTKISCQGGIHAQFLQAPLKSATIHSIWVQSASSAGAKARLLELPRVDGAVRMAPSGLCGVLVWLNDLDRAFGCLNT